MLRTRATALRAFRSTYVCTSCSARPQSQPLQWQSHVPRARLPAISRPFASSSSETKEIDEPKESRETDETRSAEELKELGDAKAQSDVRTSEASEEASVSKTSSLAKNTLKNRRQKRNRALRKQAASLGTKSEPMQQVLESLKVLEQSYATLSKKLDKATKQSGPAEDQANDKVDAQKLEAKAAKKQKALEARMKTISGTLDVLRNVLATQQIPIDDLRKKTKPGEAEGEAQPTAQEKSQPTAQETTQPTAQEEPGPTAQKKTPSPPKSKKAPKPQATTAPADPKSSTNKNKNKNTAAAGAGAGAVTSLAARLAWLGRNQSRATANDAVDVPSARSKGTQGSIQPLVPRLGRFRSQKKPIRVRSITANKLELTPVEVSDMPTVPTLAYGLERALFNPGVYHLQDPRSKVYNFDPYLSRIMPLNEFDFSALQQYVTSSKDSTLYELAAKLGKKYSGSTSSMTAILSHFHYLLSAWRPINTKNLSGNFDPEWKSFTSILRAPAAGFLHLRDGVYAIDADKEYDTANILSMLGKSMEKLLTLDKDEFERYRHKNSDQISEEERNASEAYHFSTMGDFLMRSQLDATDKRLPGTGMFDLKTRAVVSIRMDAQGFQKGLGYEIRKRFGQWESFEREYYDMIRSAFLKYSLQVRMGRMDGIFVAYHNTQRIFGFQYIPLEEMDEAIHGSRTRSLGDQEFKLSLHLLNKALDRATSRFPGRAIRLHVETRPASSPGSPPFMYIFAKPVNSEEIDKVQSANKAAIAAFERKWLGLQQENAEVEPVEPDKEVQQAQEEESPEQVEDARQQALSVWEEMQEKVEEAVEDDARGISHVREAIQDALEQSGLLKARSPVEARSYVEGLLDVLVRSGDYEVEDDIAATKENDEAVEKADQTTEIVEDVVDNGAANASDETVVSDTPEETNVDASTTQTTTKSTSASDLGLKELILRVAEQLDDKPEEPEAHVSEDGTSDSSRLGDFERILSDLVATSRGESSSTDEGSFTIEETQDPKAPEFEQSRRDAAEDAQTAGEEGASAAELDDTLTVEGNELLGMHLMIRNKVNGRYVERPEVSGQCHWTLEYCFEEIPPESAKNVYAAMQKRRQKTLEFTDAEDRDSRWRQMFRGKLEEMSKAGRARRANYDHQARNKPVHVLGMDGPLEWKDAFAHHQQWVDTTSNKK